MENKKKILIILVIIIITIILGAVILYYSEEESTSIDILDEMESSIVEANTNVNYVENNDKNNNKTVDNGELIAVHITGEVQNRGMIYLKLGSRINDAIEEAGGTTKDANLDKVNLAYVLSDGQKIYIPNKNEKDETIEYIISDSGENILLDDGNNKETISSKGVSEKVNINDASQTELETLPGIGPSLAQNIIEYRQTNGKFQKIEDLQNVKGIGDSKYSNIKDRVCI